MIEPPYERPDQVALKQRPPEGLLRVFCDDEFRLRTGWRLLLFVIAFVIIEVAIQIAVGVFLIIWIYATQDASADAEQLTEILETTLSEQLWTITLIAAVPEVVALFGLVYVFRRFVDRRSLRSVGLIAPRIGWLQSTVIGLVLGMAPILLVAGILFASGELKYVGRTLAWHMLLVIVPGLMLKAFHEELLCRGYLLQNFVDVRLPWLGVLITSLLFWLVHSLNPDAWASPLVGINLFLAGVFLALCFLITGDLWFATVVHFGWNFAQGPLLGIPVSGIEVQGLYVLERTGELPVWVSGGSFGFEASALCTAVLLLLVAILTVIWQRQRSSRGAKADPSQGEGG